MTKIGKNIKKIRNIKGLSQQLFAESFGLTRGNISSYEESRAEPKIEVILKIANFFGIPVADFIQKELSVNELLHYNSNLVIETEKLKVSQQFKNIPFISTHSIKDFIQQRDDPDFIRDLPLLTVPCTLKSELIALELNDSENLPSGFTFRNGDILVLEAVTKENSHRIADKLGMMIDTECLRFGIYKKEDEIVSLSLNDWIKYPFDLRHDVRYWLLRASYRHEL